MAVPNPLQNGSKVSNSLVHSATSFFTDLLKSSNGNSPEAGTSVPNSSDSDKSKQALALLNSSQTLGSTLLHRAQIFTEQAVRVLGLSTQLCVQNIRREIALSQLPPEVRKAFENRAGIDRLNTAIQNTENRIKLLDYLSKDTQMSFTQKEGILKILVEDLAQTQQKILKEEDLIAPEFKDTEWLKMLGEEETVYSEKTYTETSIERYNNDDAVGSVGKDLKAPGDFVHERENPYILNIKSDAKVLENKHEVDHYNYSGLIDHLQQWALNQKHAQVMHLKMRIVGELKSAGLEHLPQNEIPELYARLRSYGDQISSTQVQSELDRASLRQPIDTQIEITHQMAQKLFENGEKIGGFVELEAGFTKAKQLYDQGKYSEAKAVFIENYKNPLREKLALRFKEIVDAEIEKNKVSYTVSLALITVAAVGATILTDGLGTAFAVRGMQWGLGEFFCNATLFYASHEALTMGYEHLTGREVHIKNLSEHGVDLLFNYGMFGALGKSMSAFQKGVKESLALKYFEKTGKVLNETEKDLLFARYVKESGLKDKLVFYSKQYGVEYTTLMGWNTFETTARGALEGHFDPLAALGSTLSAGNLSEQALFLIGLKMGSWAARPVTRFVNFEIERSILGPERAAQLRDLGKSFEDLQKEYMDFLGKAEVDSTLFNSSTHHDLLSRYQGLLEARQRVLTTLPADLIREDEVRDLSGDISLLEARRIDPYPLIQSLKNPFAQEIAPSGFAGAYDLVSKAIENYLLIRTWNAKEVLAVKMEALRLGQQSGKFQAVTDPSSIGIHQAIDVIRERITTLRDYMSAHPKAIPEHFPLFEKIKEMERLKQEEVQTKPVEVSAQNSISWNVLAERLNQGASEESLAQEINGSVATGGVSDIRLARKVISVLQDIEAVKQNPHDQLSRRFALNKRIEETLVVRGVNLKAEDYVKLLDYSSSSGAEFLSRASKLGHIKIKILSETEFSAQLRKTQAHPESLDPSYQVKAYYNHADKTIVLRQLPSFDLGDTHSRLKATAEVRERLGSLIHEGEHWSHFNGYFEGRESRSSALNPNSGDRQTLIVAEMMAYLEQSRWEALNGDSRNIQKTSLEGKNLAQYYRDFIGKHYFKE